MTSEELKAFCKERNLTYKELAQKIGYSESALKTILSTGKISDNLIKSIELLKTVYELEAQLKETQALKTTLKKLLDLN